MGFATTFDNPELSRTNEQVLRILQVYSPHRLSCFGKNYFKATIREPWDKQFAAELKDAAKNKKVSQDLRTRIIEALERHKRNARLCAALYPVLQSAEIVTRNALSVAISEHFGHPTWLDDALKDGEACQRATPGLLEDYDLDEITRVDKRRGRLKKEYDSDPDLRHSNVLAELDFNFWRCLVTDWPKGTDQERTHQTEWKKLWEDLVPKVIPFAAKQDRGFFFTLLTNALELRIAIAHQYPLWICPDKLKLRQRFRDHKSFLTERYDRLKTLINGVGPKADKETASKPDNFENELNKFFSQ
jgi:hypothetical protein